VPAAVEAPTANVAVDEPEPGAAIEDGLKDTVTPAGAPLADSATALLKPPETVVETVDEPELPCTTETDVGEAAIVKSGVTTTAGVTDTQVDGAEPQASLPLG
jgi:hypothetical protein